MKTKEKRVVAPRRTSFLFPTEAATALENIRARTYFDDDADVIRIALAVCDNILELAELHCSIAVRDTNGQEWPYSPYTRFEHPNLGEAVRATPSTKKRPAKNFFFSGEAVERLDSIRARSEVRTNANVIRLALTIFNQLVQVHSAGHRIVVRTTDGEESFFNIFNPQARQMICSRAKLPDTSGPI
jgi:hypothetical protein